MSPQLAAEWADTTQAALAEADRKFHDIHGRNESEWSPMEWDSYDQLMAKVRSFFSPVVEVA